MPIENKKIDWDTLLYTIKHEECVLFIGPELARSKKGSYFNKALYELLIDDSKDSKFYFSQDDLFVIDNKDRVAILKNIDKFLQISFNEDLYRKLAFIPIHLIISTSPDLFLKKAFEENNLQYEYHYYTYNFDENLSEIGKSDSSKPLLYNMMGSTEDRSSLIITYKDLYRYLKAILGNKQLPIELLNELKNGSRFIFLGFKFEKWYVQLLLALLHEESSKDGYEGWAPAINLSPEADVICSQQFNITFIESDIEAFVDELYTRCEESGMLREVVREEVLISNKADKAKALFDEHKIKEALDVLNDLKKELDKSMNFKIDILSSRYKSYKEKLNSGALYQNEANVEFSKIKISLLDVIEEIKSLEQEDIKK
jgi:hypothetical protein